MTVEMAVLPYGSKCAPMYPPGMAKRVLMGIQEFRLNLRARVLAGRDLGEHTLVSSRGKPVGVYVPMEWYRRASDGMGEPLGDSIDAHIRLVPTPADDADDI